jgi:hypothetical protein
VWIVGLVGADQQLNALNKFANETGVENWQVNTGLHDGVVRVRVGMGVDGVSGVMESGAG